MRIELLRYMQAFSSSVAGIQKVLGAIQVFLNREDSFKKKEIHHKKSKIYLHKDDPDTVNQYRGTLIKKFTKWFYEDNNPERGGIIYNHLRCVTEMDDRDWDLLIAYTLITADDESDEKIKLVEVNLQNLIVQVNKA